MPSSRLNAGDSELHKTINKVPAPRELTVEQVGRRSELSFGVCPLCSTRPGSRCEEWSPAFATCLMVERGTKEKPVRPKY